MTRAELMYPYTDTCEFYCRDLPHVMVYNSVFIRCIHAEKPVYMNSQVSMETGGPVIEMRKPLVKTTMISVLESFSFKNFCCTHFCNSVMRFLLWSFRWTNDMQSCIKDIWSVMILVILPSLLVNPCWLLQNCTL